MSAYITKADYYVPCQQLFHELHTKPMAVFLDSSLSNDLGRYSIIGISPYHVLKEVSGTLFINGEKSEQSFDTYLKEYLAKHKEDNPTDLPLLSGGIGYFSYDYGMGIEHIPTRHPKNCSMPEVILAFYDCFFIEDTHKQELYLIANGKCKKAEDSIRQMQELVHRLSVSKIVTPAEASYPNYTLREIASLVETYTTKEEYRKTIEQVIDYIVQGHVYVMNLTQQLTMHSNRDPYQVFQRLQQHNPAPFSAYLNYEDGQIISASPERFLRIKDHKIETRPIKGTRKRGENESTDALLKEELQNSEKDKSELLMIVDLERNDLNRVCIPGSVKVTELFEVETYATVFHLIANIVGTLPEDVDLVDVLHATFPGGSITGAPKVRAMEIIDELECSPRGIYTGILGYVSLNGDCDFNISIRTAIHQKGTYHIGVGGGITYESDTLFEYEETLQKAKALVEAISDSDAVPMDSKERSRQ